MRILLDECLPRELADELVGHEVRTVGRMGWAGKKNGELLRLAARQFDAFVTADRSLTYQQDVRGLNLGVVTLVAHSNEIETGSHGTFFVPWAFVLLRGFRAITLPLCPE